MSSIWLVGIECRVGKNLAFLGARFVSSLTDNPHNHTNTSTDAANFPPAYMDNAWHAIYDQASGSSIIHNPDYGRQVYYGSYKKPRPSKPNLTACSPPYEDWPGLNTVEMFRYATDPIPRHHAYAHMCIQMCRPQFFCVPDEPSKIMFSTTALRRSALEPKARCLVSAGLGCLENEGRVPRGQKTA
ncbi:hypothetical protein TWF718_000049 [Orbilia javanica]|uniref:Uncharacterized protein n=1 Tax=Orbilia javanica TaxID=47235 RepID=A0AAN8MTB8_9PEZI